MPSKYKQIRICVDNATYSKLKAESKLFGLDLMQYSRLILAGLRITKNINLD